MMVETTEEVKGCKEIGELQVLYSINFRFRGKFEGIVFD